METQHTPHSQQPAWVHITFPASFVHPYTMTDQQGNQWDKAIITLPAHTTINGITADYYNIDVFLTPTMKEQKATNKPVTLSVPDNKSIELFRGRKERRTTFLIENPWQLAKAVKNSRRYYAAHQMHGSQEIQEKKSRIKNQRTFPGPLPLPDTQDRITVSIIFGEIGIYNNLTEPLTMSFAQADYELTELDYYRNKALWKYPAAYQCYEKIYLTLSGQINGREITSEQRIDLEPLGHGLTTYLERLWSTPEHEYKYGQNTILPYLKAHTTPTWEEIQDSNTRISQAITDMDTYGKRYNRNIQNPQDRTRLIEGEKEREVITEQAQGLIEANPAIDQKIDDLAAQIAAHQHSPALAWDDIVHHSAALTKKYIDPATTRFEIYSQAATIIEHTVETRVRDNLSSRLATPQPYHHKKKTMSR